MMRRLLLAAVVGLWVVLLLYLGDAPQMPPTPPVDLPVASAGVATGRWQHSIVWSGAQRVGDSWFRQLPSATGEIIQQATALRLQVLGGAQEVSTRSRAHVDGSGAVLDLAFSLKSPTGRVRAKLVRTGGELHLAVAMGVQRERRVLAVAEPIYLPTSLRRRLAGHLQPGATESGLVFDALGGEARALTLRAVRRRASDDVWVVEESYGGLKTEVWMRTDGTVERESGPLGLQTTLLAQGEIEPQGGAGYLDVESATAIVVGPIRDARTRQSLRLRVGGVDLAQLPQAAGQRLEGEWLVIDRPVLDSLPRLPLGSPVPSGDAWTRPEERVQSADPRMVALAREVVGDASDVLTAARRLVDWVYVYLEKEATIGVPNALATLDAGRGDCNEHAVLLTAMARAVGIPARPVAGVVYLQDKFVYHAWVEILVGTQWVAVDPALGQLPADATHVALASGFLSDATRMLALVGRLELQPEP